MSNHRTRRRRSSAERKSSFEVSLGSHVLDFGSTSVARLMAHFWIYLSCEGDRLTDWDYAHLMQVLILRQEHDYELREENVPMQASSGKRDRGREHLRNMGLIFTERIYYPSRPGQPPVMRAQRWDFRSLFYNLELIGQEWLSRQKELVEVWELGGKQGPKPVYNFPPGYAHDVVLPEDVAVDILRGVFYPVPKYWLQRAEMKFQGTPTTQNTQGRMPTTQIKQGTPTTQNTHGRAPTTQIKRGHLLEEEEEEGGRFGQTRPSAPIDIAAKVFACFAAHQGNPDYSPIPKERAALQKMLDAGYIFEEIAAWIDEAFSRPNQPRYFTFVSILAFEAYETTQSRLPETCQPEARNQESLPQSNPTHACQPEARKEAEARTYPEIRPQPEARIQDHRPQREQQPCQPEARTQPEARSQESLPQETMDIETALDIYQSTGREVSPDVLARLRLLAGRCDAVARAQGATGGEWLADALEAALGIADPNKLLNYAASALKDWAVNGKPGMTTKTIADANDAAPEALAPELLIFQEATNGRLPLPDQRQIVIDAIRQCRFTAVYLRPFWNAWVAQDRKRSSLDWLLDWADKGAIPQPYYGKTQTDDKPQFKSLPALQALAAKYGVNEL